MKVTGVTVSKEQLALAQQRVRGLPVELLLQDYRDLQGSFDKVVSVGMFEHVGPKNYDTYFTNVQRLMAPEGIFLLHTIGIAATSQSTDPWIDRYVFPNGSCLGGGDLHRRRRPLHHRGLAQLRRRLRSHADGLVGPVPARLAAVEERYGKRFYRMWQYYLMCCAGFFRSREGQLWQVILTHPQRGDTYRSLR